MMQEMLVNAPSLDKHPIWLELPVNVLSQAWLSRITNVYVQIFNPSMWIPFPASVLQTHLAHIQIAKVGSELKLPIGTFQYNS